MEVKKNDQSRERDKETTEREKDENQWVKSQRTLERRLEISLLTNGLIYKKSRQWDWLQESEMD